MVGRSHAEVREVLDHGKVGATPRSDGARFRETEAVRRVDGCHANGRHGGYARRHRHAKVFFHMAFERDVRGICIVVAEHAHVGVLGRDAADEFGEVLCGRSLTDHHAHAPADALAHFFEGRTFVVARNSRHDAGRERFAQHPRRVTVDRTGARARIKELLKQIGIFAEHPRHVHDFPEPENTGMRVEGPKPFGVKRRSRVFEGRRGNARGEHEADVKREAFGRVEHVSNPLGPENVCNLVRVGNNDRRPVRKNEFGKTFGNEHRRFDVNMRVDEAREQNAALQVHGFKGFGRTRRDAVHDDAVRDEHVDVRQKGARENVGNGAVRKTHLGGRTVRGGIESALKLLARHRKGCGLRGLKHGFPLGRQELRSS